ncbi:acyl carrier protein [Streptomyces hygroscopicus]|uniref:acyl carrier protein n=1 Tax=Streptomyces hygroscopicus TaxID=1912 RepID=UPI00340EE97D
MSEDIRTPIREFISAKFPQISIDDDEDIFALGFVNSLFAMELVMFVERTFGVRVPNEQLKLDNFRTMNAMADLVRGLSESMRLSAG